jgi:hypothetical protein
MNKLSSPGLVQTHNNNNNNNNNKKSLSMSEQASLQTPFLHVCALQKQARFCLASISFCAFLSEVVHCLAKQVLNNKSCISKRKEKDNCLSSVTTEKNHLLSITTHQEKHLLDDHLNQRGKHIG